MVDGFAPDRASQLLDLAGDLPLGLTPAAGGASQSTSPTTAGGSRFMDRLSRLLMSRSDTRRVSPRCACGNGPDSRGVPLGTTGTTGKPAQQADPAVQRRVRLGDEHGRSSPGAAHLLGYILVAAVGGTGEMTLIKVFGAVWK